MPMGGQRKNKMKPILVDDELWALNILESELEKIVNIGSLRYASGEHRHIETEAHIPKGCSVEEILGRARFLSKYQKKSVEIRTFGKFDVFVDGLPVRFKDAKAKELLAICVDRKGELVGTEEVIDKLWKDIPKNETAKACYQKTVAYLHALMMDHRVPEVFVSGCEGCQVTKETFSCDYYEFLELKDSLAFFRKYMGEYSWADKTAVWLNMNQQKLHIF